MKKILILCAAVLLSASASAQALVESKSSDNIYIGLNGGVGIKTTDSKLMDDINPDSALAATSLRSSVWLLRVMPTSATILIPQQVQW